MEDHPGTGTDGQPPDGPDGGESEIDALGTPASASPVPTPADLAAGHHVVDVDADAVHADEVHALDADDQDSPRPTVRTTGEPSPLISRRARAGDNTAYARLVEHYDVHLRAFAIGMVGEPERLDAVLDDAYIRAYRAIPRLSPDVTPDGWLCRATYLACIDALRRTRRRRDIRADELSGSRDSAVGGDRIGAAATSTDTRTDGAVTRTLQTLSLEERAALLLVDGEGFGHRTVAETLDIDQAEVPRLLSRARAELLTVVDEDPLVALDHGDALRATLRSLPIPEHDAGFWNRLGGRLLRERERPAVSPLDPVERLAARPPQDGTIPDEWTQGSVSKLARQADLVRDAPDRRHRWLVAGIAGLVVAVVGIALWIGFSAAPDSRSTTAADVAVELTDNLADAPYIVGELRISGTTPSGQAERYQLVHAADGSFRVAGDAGTATLDANAGASRELLPSDGRAPGLLELTGLAAGPPDPVGDNRYRLEDDLALVARAFVNAADTPVRPAMRAGREVWLLSQPVEQGVGGVDRIDVSVDRERALPVEVARYRDGDLVERRQLSGLAVRARVTPGSFTIDPPSGARVGTVDRGFRRTSAPQVGEAVGYDAVTPSWLPDGFELTDVAYLAGTHTGATPAGAQNPPDTDVISLAYRRGVQQVTVTTRRDGGPTVRWVDPFGADQASEPVSTRLQAGRFHGTTVQEVAGDALVQSRLWGRADGLVFTLSGDVAAADLQRMADSLR